jgi:hypothetical protein
VLVCSAHFRSILVWLVLMVLRTLLLIHQLQSLVVDHAAHELSVGLRVDPRNSGRRALRCTRLNVSNWDVMRVSGTNMSPRNIPCTSKRNLNRPWYLSLNPEDTLFTVGGSGSWETSRASVCSSIAWASWCFVVAVCRIVASLALLTCFSSDESTKCGLMGAAMTKGCKDR